MDTVIDPSASSDNPPTPEPTPTTEAPDWRQGLPEDIRGDSLLETVKSVDDLAKGYIHAQRTIGKKGVLLPSREAPPEEWSAFYNAIGRPETVDGYELPQQGLPDGFAPKADDPVIQSFFNRAHELGLTKQQAAGLVRFQAESAASAREAQDTAYEQAKIAGDQQLRQEWGVGYDDQMAMAKQALKQFGDQGLIEHLDQSGLGNDPRMIKTFARIGRLIAEDQILGHGQPTAFRNTPDMAKRELARLKADPEFRNALSDPDHPGYEQARAKSNALYQEMYPDEA